MQENSRLLYDKEINSSITLAFKKQTVFFKRMSMLCSILLYFILNKLFDMMKRLTHSDLTEQTPSCWNEAKILEKGV